VGAYNDLVPAFEALLAQQGGDLPSFFAATERLAALPKAQRDAALRVMLPPAAEAGLPAPR
jgi:predicted aminopeptidase